MRWWAGYRRRLTSPLAMLASLLLLLMLVPPPLIEPYKSLYRPLIEP
jgi:hypothetical protein